MGGHTTDSECQCDLPHGCDTPGLTTENAELGPLRCALNGSAASQTLGGFGFALIAISGVKISEGKLVDAVACADWTTLSLQKLES